MLERDEIGARAVARIAGVFTLLLGLAGLVGWLFDVTPLKSVLPGLVTMKMNTAVGLLLAGMSLVLQLNVSRPVAWSWLARAGAVIVTGIGGLTLGEYLLGADFGIDELLIKAPAIEIGTSHIGRMAPTTALNFLLSGLVLAWLDNKILRWFGQALVLVVLLIALVAFSGYALNVTALYGVTGYTWMAMHTALGFSALAVGILAARPERGPIAIIIQDNPAGATARRLLPTLFAVPLALGWAIRLGQERGVYSAPFGFSITATFSIVVLVALVLWNAHVQGDAERALKSSEERLRALNNELEARVASRTLELSTMLSEREVLLQEVHHRVKNNLQVVSSLINMQARRLDAGAGRSALEECKTRVEAIANIHEQLYRSRDYARVPFSEYAESLSGNVFRASGISSEQVTLRLELDTVSLPVDKAIPCGLILNELITNALKHAFPLGRHGVVTLVLRALADDAILLSVSDDGIGMPADFALERAPSLGLSLVATLSGQLDGKLEIAQQGGTLVRVTFRAEKRK